MQTALLEASWRRSLDAGLRRDRLVIPFDANVDGDGRLVRAARPVLDQLAVDVAGGRVAVVLSDARGLIIDRRVPDPSLVETLDAVSLAPGFLYAEDAVGTNGIGTAIAQRAPALVEGDEHFADAFAGVACAGAPIGDPASGRVVGAIDLTCLAPEASPLMVALVTRAARDIEFRLLDDARLTDRLVLQRFLQERRRAKGPFVLVTDRTVLTNAAADRLVTPSDEPVLRGCVGRPHSTVVLSGGAGVSVRSEPVVDGGHEIGALLRLRPVVAEIDVASARRASHARPTFGWESLTDTERSVVELVAQGLTNREAAERLFLSHHTVGFHLRSIFRKLDVTSRVDLTRLVVERAADAS